jgi:hypothetical protein
MKTQLTFALVILISSQVFSQSTKIVATQKASTSSSVRASDQATATGSASASTSATASTSGIKEHSTEARQQLNATGESAVEAKQRIEAETRQKLDNNAKLAVSSDPGSKAGVEVKTSSDNLKIDSRSRISAQPAINASTHVVSQVETVQSNATQAIRANASTGVQVTTKSVVAANNGVKPVLRTRSNFQATQNNSLKMKPVSVRSKTMTSGKVRL